MTAPLVPAEVDLRGMPFMPLDVVRLRDSNLAIERTGEEFRAAVLLWCASWSQVPAASLPSDDRALAAYTGHGRDLKGWRKLRDGALHGFVLCDDGRLYHPVVAEKALEAWAERVDYRDGRDNERLRKQRERDDRKIMFKALREAGQVLPWNTHTARLRELVDTLPVTDQSVTGAGDTGVSGHRHDTAKTETETETETGTGTGTGTGILKALSSETSAQTATALGSAEDLARALREVGFPDCSAAHPDVVAAAADGITGKELQAVAVQKPGKGIGYLVQAARGRRADAAERREQSRGAPTATVTPIDPTAKAKGDARHAMDDKIQTARNDCWHELIDEATRDQRINEAVEAFEAAWPSSQAVQA